MKYDVIDIQVGGIYRNTKRNEKHSSYYLVTGMYERVYEDGTKALRVYGVSMDGAWFRIDSEGNNCIDARSLVRMYPYEFHVQKEVEEDK